MRERKLRAWNTFSEKMEYGNEVGIKGWGINELLSDEDRHFMECTGLKDKNGVEIYEGDIVRIHYIEASSRIFEAMKEYDAKYIDFKISESEHGLIGVRYETLPSTPSELEFFEYYGNIQFLVYLMKKESLEVIGNTHENIELLKNNV